MEATRVLKNKQKNYPHYLNPNSAGFLYLRDYAIKIEDKASSNKKGLDLMSEEQFNQFCKERKNGMC